MASNFGFKISKLFLNSQNALSQHFVRGLADATSNVNPLKIGFVGAPFSRGQPHGGLEKSPDLLRQSGLFKNLRLIGHDVLDEGDVIHTMDENAKVVEPEFAINFKENMDYNKKLSDKVCDVVSSGRVCVTVGGDHSIGLGTVYGHAKAYKDENSMCLLWVDAHGDIETPDVSPSKNMHGMPVSFHIKELFPNHYQSQSDQLKWFRPCLRVKDLVFIGLRELELCETVFLKQYNIQHFTMRDVDVLGINEVVRKSLELINPGNKRPLHVSFDIDALDPVEAPATGTKVPGGLTLREGLTIMEEVALTGTLRGLDLVEVNPSLANSEQEVQKTVEAAKRLILAATGFPRVLSAI